MKPMHLFALAGVALPALGAVLESDGGGFVSAHEIEIQAPPERVYEALVAEVGEWLEIQISLYMEDY